jgi:hypothetical protein
MATFATIMVSILAAIFNMVAKTHYKFRSASTKLNVNNSPFTNRFCHYHIPHMGKTLNINFRLYWSTSKLSAAISTKIDISKILDLRNVIVTLQFQNGDFCNHYGVHFGSYFQYGRQNTLQISKCFKAPITKKIDI